MSELRCPDQYWNLRTGTEEAWGFNNPSVMGPTTMMVESGLLLWIKGVTFPGSTESRDSSNPGKISVLEQLL